MRIASRAQLTRIEVAAEVLMCARVRNYAYANEGFLSGDRPTTLRVLKQAENAFWKACRDMVIDESTGGGGNHAG